MSQPRIVPEKPPHEAMMAGYEVAKKFGVYEARAFDLAEEMYVAMVATIAQPINEDR